MKIYSEKFSYSLHPARSGKYQCTCGTKHYWDDIVKKWKTDNRRSPVVDFSQEKLFKWYGLTEEEYKRRLKKRPIVTKAMRDFGDRCLRY